MHLDIQQALQSGLGILDLQPGIPFKTCDGQLQQLPVVCLWPVFVCMQVFSVPSTALTSPPLRYRDKVKLGKLVIVNGNGVPGFKLQPPEESCTRILRLSKDALYIYFGMKLMDMMAASKP